MLSWTGAALLGCSALQAGEQVQFKGSTSVELPKPKRAIDDDRKIRVDDEGPNLTEGGFVRPPGLDSSPLSDRKTREALDKKKNWIYMNPYERQFDSKTEQFLEGEKSTGLYENRWMKSDEEKTAVQKFIEEKDPRRKEENLRKESSLRKDRDNEDSPDRQGASETSVIGLPEDSNFRKDDDTFTGTGLRSQVDFVNGRGASSDPFASGPLGKSEKNPLTDNPFSKKPAASSFEREELKQQQIAHEKDFESILSTRLGTAGSAPVVGRLDSFNAPGAGTSLDLNSSMRRSDQAINFGRSTGPTTATFTDGAPGFNAGRSIETRSFGDAFSSKAPAPTSPFAPSVPQAPAIQSPGFTPSAFSLPSPKRKF